MLAVRGEHVPTGPDWVHEVKWDGIRALVEVSDGAVRVLTRSGRDVSAAFPELAGLAVVAGDVLLDGEIVLLGDGVPTLNALGDRLGLGDARKAIRLAAVRPVTLLAFDLLATGARDLTTQPWSERRELLEGLGLDDVSWQVPQTYDDGVALLEAAEQQGLEGIVSKRVGSRYAWGIRSRDWLKFPIRPTGSYVVGGYRHQTGSDHRIGALLLGEPTTEGLAYRGRVGSGISGKAARVLDEVLAPLVRENSPFAGQSVPRLDALSTVWVEPVLVVDAQYLQVTRDGRLRQPSYRGLRADLTPSDLL